MPMLTTLRMRLPVCPLHAPLRTRCENRAHPIEHSVHFGHDVLAVHDDRRVLRRPQGNVQNGALLGDIDLLAAKHGVDPLAQAGLIRQLRAT